MTEIEQKITEHISSDNSKNKQAHEKLLVSQTNLARIIDIANEGIISIDQSQRVIIFNKGAENIFDYAAEEVIGQPLDMLLPDRFASVHRLHVTDFAESALSARLMGDRQEIIGRRKDGEEFPAEASISKLEINSEMIFTVVLRDITERKQTQQERERLAILEERERFARDLHDGIIQSIYGVSLALDNVRVAISPNNTEALKLIDLILESLAPIITDIRNYIFDLRPQALKGRGLYVRLQGLLKELKINTLLTIESEIDPNINAYLTEMQARHIFHIAHEALANVARHAKARRVHLSLTKRNNFITLLIEDDGIGFVPTHEIYPGHHGLSNIQERVSLLGATFQIDSLLNQGTRISLKLAVASG